MENPVNVTPLPRPAALDAISHLESLEGTGADGSDEYASLKRLQRHLEYVGSSRVTRALTDDWDRYIQLQEEYIKDEQRHVP